MDALKFVGKYFVWVVTIFSKYFARPLREELFFCGFPKIPKWFVRSWSYRLWEPVPDGLLDLTDSRNQSPMVCLVSQFSILRLRSSRKD